MPTADRRRDHRPSAPAVCEKNHCPPRARLVRHRVPRSDSSRRPAGHARATGAAVEDGGMHDRTERMARRFQWPVIVAALLVVPVIVLEEFEPARPDGTDGAALPMAG